MSLNAEAVNRMLTHVAHLKLFTALEEGLQQKPMQLFIDYLTLLIAQLIVRIFVWLWGGSYLIASDDGVKKF